MKKLPASSQNARDARTVAERAHRGSRTDCRRGGRRHRARSPPYGASPRSDGRSRMKSSDERQHDDERDRRRGAGGVAPAPLRDDPGEQRQEDQLPARVRRRQQPGDEPAAPHEPAVRDRSPPSGTEIAPVAVPLTTPQRTSSCHGAVISVLRPAPTEIAEHGDRDHAPHPVALDERGRERAAEAVDHEIDRDREADRRAAPAELVLQRHDQDAVVDRKPADVISVTSPTATMIHE